MRILFLHQSFPGQFRHLVRHFADTGCDVTFITQPNGNHMTGIRRVNYEPNREPMGSTHHYIRDTERSVLYGQGAVRAAIQLAQAGWIPDIIVGHNGWGELLFLKEVFPDTPMLGYFEFYYHANGVDLNFDPEFQTEIDDAMRVRMKNTVNLLGLETCDAGLSPTLWQKSLYPVSAQSKIRVIHDGIDTLTTRPDDNAVLTLPDGTTLSRQDEILTYVARNLEPYRGIHTFLRALPELLARRPNARVVIVGGDGISYGRPSADGRSYREILLDEISIDLDRVHFLGQVSYEQFLQVLQISRLHVYLTYPFVLSWSMLEAMSAGCVVLGSATPPVQEVIEDGRNGFLTNFFDHGALATRAAELLADHSSLSAIRAAARHTVVERYDLHTRCLPQHLGFIDELRRGFRGRGSRH